QPVTTAWTPRLVARCCRGTAFAVPRRAAGPLRTARDDGHGAAPGGARAPRPLPGGDRRRHRWHRPTPLHRGRAPRLPRLRPARAGLRPGAVRPVSLRTPPPVLVQNPRDLSELRRAPHGRASGAPRRRSPAVGAGAPVGAHRAAPAPLPSGVRP